MGQRLLLVDSDRSFLKEHQISLEAAFDLEVAASPEGVVSRLESDAFAAVLICVEVAENKGYALCSTIRRNTKLEGVKIGLISAKATEEEYRRHQSLKGRADLYLHKPVAPSALVAALAPIVPGRALDPDNPLGELVDTELGEDWLDSLKGAIEHPGSSESVAPVFGIRPVITAAVPHLDAKATAPPDTSRMRLLEEQVSALHEELRAKDQQLADAIKRLTESDLRLQASGAEVLQIQRQMNSVTLNLDELERSNREAETLKARLAETEANLRSLEENKGREGESAEALKAQLKEALTERGDLIQQVEALNQQVGEKAQRVIELLKERDRLMNEVLDLEPFRAKTQELEPFRAKAQELEEALAGREQELASRQAALAEKDAALVAKDDALSARDEALAAKDGLLATKDEELAARQRERDEARQAQEQLNTTIEGLVEQQGRLEGIHQAALLEVAGYKEKAHSTQLELAGVEATMRGQGRDLAELGAQLRQREADLEASRAEALEGHQQVLAKEEGLRQHRADIEQLRAQLAGLRQELDATVIQHDGERLELMNGLDQKEVEIARLNQALAQQQDAHAALEGDKQALQGQLSEHRDRLQNLGSLMTEIQDQLRRGSDLARG